LGKALGKALGKLWLALCRALLGGNRGQPLDRLIESLISPRQDRMTLWSLGDGMVHVFVSCSGAHEDCLVAL
jgi:hypothetical protein